MDEKSSTVNLNTNKNSFEIEVKDDNNKEQTIDTLIEPTIAVNIDEPVKSSPTIAIRLVGIFYILLAAFIFTTSIFIAKELKVDVLDALIPCYILHSTILLIYTKLIKHYLLYQKSKKQEIFFLFINVFFSTTGIFTFYFAYRYLPLPDLITIRYTQVIWTAIIITILYREKPSIPMIVAILLTTIGVIFVAQPNFLFNKISNKDKTSISNDYYQRLKGLLIALYSSIALSIMIISNKHLLTKYKTKNSLIMLQYAIVTLCVLIGKVFYKYNFFIDDIQAFKNDFFNWKYLCASLICLLHILAIVLTQKAVKREHPSIFTIVQSSNILFSILLQNIFSSMKSNLLSIVGSMLVLTSIAIVTGLKFFNEKKQNKK
ncbi:unnamed protein product [Rotaria sordida]|uniref:EamA domain-containing protein n=1 Tax=Rotaria sordida TaxID=392033 RepID=A0A814XBS0_9BILA|nr:unnamed protein product [Rotaria sordida]CAF1215703.1 unnamed protein product [Rotaria sordida]